MNKSGNCNSEGGQELNDSDHNVDKESAESVVKVGQDESGHEDDDEEILNTWLGELNTLKKVNNSYLKLRFDLVNTIDTYLRL